MLFLYIMYLFIGKVEVEGYFQRRPVTHTSSAHVGTQNFKQKKTIKKKEVKYRWMVKGTHRLYRLFKKYKIFMAKK